MNPNNGVIWTYVKLHPIKIISVIITSTILYLSIQWTIEGNTEDIRGNTLNIADLRTEQGDLKTKTAVLETDFKNIDKKFDTIIREIRDLRK